MGFDFTQDLRAMMDTLGNCDVSVSFGGVSISSIRGIFDQSNEAVSPFESSQIMVKPQVTVLESDFQGYDSNNTLTINGKEYLFDGKPRSDGEGLTIIYLGVKK